MMRRAVKLLVPPALRPGPVAHRLLGRMTGDPRVLSGPFSGMRYVQEAHGSSYLPKLVGSYEKELHPVLERLFLQPFRRIVDVGAAEGYYAAGFAKRFPSTEIIAFEAVPEARKLLFHLLAINGLIGRVDVRDSCAPPDLASAADSRDALILMDVEGAELELLDPARVPALKSATILFESHHPRPVIQEVVLSKYAGTHRIELVTGRERTYRDVTHLNPLARWYVRDMLFWWTDEGRGCLMDWFVLEAIGRET